MLISVPLSIFDIAKNAESDMQYTLDDILVPIGSNSTERGYFRAMKGLQELDVDGFEAGCKEEISHKGKYWIESHILMAYIHTSCNKHLFA